MYDIKSQWPRLTINEKFDLLAISIIKIAQTSPNGENEKLKRFLKILRDENEALKKELKTANREITFLKSTTTKQRNQLKKYIDNWPTGRQFKKQ